MSIKIITDSGSDMMKIKDPNLKCVPLGIRFGEEEYKDDENLSHREFYEKLIETDELPQTSQATPYQWEEAMDEALNNGDEVIVITLSSKLSGTYQSAVLAAQDKENVTVIDSENVTLGQQALVTLALDLVKEGKSAKEITEILEKKKKDIRLVALLDTLEYLKKGGRISKSVALAGGLLNIKPVIAIKDGEVVMLGKARGSKKGNNLLMQEVEKAGGIDFDLPFFVGYTGLDTTLIDKYVVDSKPLYIEHMAAPDVHSVGGAIGTHAGPGAIALAFFANNAQ